MAITETRHEFTVPAALAGRRLDAALAALCPEYSRTSIKTWIGEGRVRVNDTPANRPRLPVHTGDRVQLAAALVPDTHTEPQALRFSLAYEDAALLVVDKPAGLVVHPGAGNRDRTLVNGLLHRFPELGALPRAGIVHRLDKDTSGLLIVARNPAAYQALTRQMAARAIHRRYAAIVHGLPPLQGTVAAAVGRDRAQRTRMRVRHDGREAVTHYRVVQRFRAHTLLELALETGRTHQIRVHMQHIGHPLVGDPTYARGRIASNQLPDTLKAAFVRLGRQALHAKSLQFEHPSLGTMLDVQSPLPADFRRVLRTLETDLAEAAIDAG